MYDKHATIVISMENSAFAEAPLTELARILRRLADDLAHEIEPKKLFDINGNAVGTFDITTP